MNRIIVLLCLISNVWCTDQLENSAQSSGIYQQDNVADAVNEFGYKLILTMMKQNKDQNVVISPTSVAGVLAMSLLGTVGKTHEELADTLGFSRNIIENRRTHEYFGDLLRSLNVNQTSSKTLYADAMFVDIQSKIRDMYSSYLTRVYEGEALSVNFNQTAEVKDKINRWVSSHTEGNIDEFLHKPLPAATKVVLLSALYFRGQWKTPFAEEYTAKSNFTKPSNDYVTADLMLNTGLFNYIFSEEDDLHMVALPYNDSITTLYVLMPRVPRRLTLHDMMTRINSSRINQLLDKMETAQCVIRLPKMDLKVSAKLENSLKTLGVQALFTPGQANFGLMIDANTVPNKTQVEILSRINVESAGSDTHDVNDILETLPNPGLHVDSVMHDVKLTINEYGTEAAAATSSMLARTVQLFRADSPFYMFIRNEKTKLITFSAVINDPTA